MKTNTQYVVCDGHTIWHSKEQKYYYAGETVDLSHLESASLVAVYATGAIKEKPVEKPIEKKKEVIANE